MYSVLLKEDSLPFLGAVVVGFAVIVGLIVERMVVGFVVKV